MLRDVSLRWICGVSLADGIHHEYIHRIAGTSENVTVRMKKNEFSWLESSRTNEGFIKKVNGKRGRGSSPPPWSTRKHSIKDTGGRSEEG